MFIGHAPHFFPPLLFDKGFILLCFILLIGSCAGISPLHALAEQRPPVVSSTGHASPRWRGPAWDLDPGDAAGAGGVNPRRCEALAGTPLQSGVRGAGRGLPRVGEPPAVPAAAWTGDGSAAPAQAPRPQPLARASGSGELTGRCGY